MNFLNGSVTIGQWFGITVRIHYLFIIYAAFRLFQAGEAWQFRLAYITMLFGIILLHEFGHCFGARAVGGRAHDILMWPLGGLAFAEAPMTPWAQFVTVAAGPAVNVIFCLITGVILFASTGRFDLQVLHPLTWYSWPGAYEPWQDYVETFFRVNWFILCFNLLPIFPMDGGQLFRVLLWKPLGLRRATMLAGQVGVVGAVLFAILGLMSGQFMLILLGMMGASVAWQHYQAARYGAIQEDFGYTARQRGSAMRDRGPSLGQRISGWFSRGRSPAANPNPGGWDRKQSEDAAMQAKVDRILAKVREHGIASLSYVERQLLERRSQMLREEDNDRLRGS